MKIALITPTLSVGGYEKVVIAYANELSRRGYEVDILCGFKTGELIDTISKDVNICSFNSRARTFVFPLIKYLKSEKPNILYCAFRTYNCIGVLAKFFAHSNVCVYATQHGFEKANRIKSFLEGRIISRADRVITAADGIADYESEKLHIDRNRYLIFNNPVINLEQMYKDEHHPWFVDDTQIPIIVTSSRLAGDKGELKCLEILSIVAKETPIRMMILGDGPALPELKKYVKENYLDESVSFLGFVNNPIGYMRQCDIFLHAAAAEGFGNVVVEALYSNIVPCVTNCSGPMQIIENGRYGLVIGSVYDEDFTKNAAESIMNIIENKVKFSGLVERSLCFEVKRSTDQFIATYNLQGASRNGN